VTPELRSDQPLRLWCKSVTHPRESQCLGFKTHITVFTEIITTYATEYFYS